MTLKKSLLSQQTEKEVHDHRFFLFKFLLIFKHCCIIKIMIFVLASMPTRTSSSCDRKTSKT